MKVTVVGAGVGGLAVAGHCALAGCETSVYEIDPTVVDAIQARGGIEMRGKEEGFARIATATTNPGEAVSGADLIIVCTQAPDVTVAANDVSPHLSPGQVVVIMPGCTGGALAFRQEMLAGGVTVSETDAFPYGCSIPEPAVASISSTKRAFGLAAVPASDTPAALDAMEQIYPEVGPAETVLHTGLANFNAILHIAPMIANAGRIEHLNGGFDFYGEGITPSVARIMAAQDAERLAVAAALKVKVPSLLDWISSTYGVKGPDLYTSIQTLSREVYGFTRAPASLEHRYLTEDIPCGAVPVADIGRRLGVDVDVTDQSITVASALLGRDLWSGARTAASLGFEGLSAEEIVKSVS